MADLLRMDYINSIPQPFMVKLWGDRDFSWPLESIDVETGLLRFDVCGRLQVSHIGEISAFKDMDGIEHNSETFYADYDQRRADDHTTTA